MYCVDSHAPLRIEGGAATPKGVDDEVRETFPDALIAETVREWRAVRGKVASPNQAARNAERERETVHGGAISANGISHAEQDLGSSRIGGPILPTRA